MFHEISTMQFEILIQIKDKVTLAHCLNNSYRRKGQPFQCGLLGSWPLKIYYIHRNFFWLPESRTICLDGWVPIQKLVEPLPLSRDARYQ